MKYNLWKLVAIILLAAALLSACGGAQPAAAEPTTVPPAPEAPPTEIVPVSTGPSVVAVDDCAGMKVTVNGTSDVKDGTCTENDLARFTVEDEVVQGYVRTNLTAYQRDELEWTAQFDGVTLRGEEPPSTNYVTQCGAPSETPDTLEQDTTLTVTCANADKDWTLTVEVDITVISDTALEPPATQAVLIPWKHMEEGKVYLFVAKAGYIQYQREGDLQVYNSHAKLVAGRLLNKSAYRVELFNVNQTGRAVTTLNPEEVEGGYPYLAPSDLRVGRVYNLCPTDTDRVMEGNELPLDQCINGVYMGIGAHQLNEFNINGEMRGYAIVGVFPDARP